MLVLLAATAMTLAMPLVARAQVKVGVILSATGPAASLGLAQKRVVPLMPAEIAGKKVEYILLDDASDTNQAVKAARKLMADEKVDLVIGPSVTAASLAVIDVAAELKTPLISMASSSRITSPMDEKRHWVFKTAMSETLAVATTLRHAAASGGKRLALVAASDAYGDTWVAEVTRTAATHGINLIATERFAASDVTALAQVAKVMAAKPDAVLVAAAGTPGLLPHKTLRERGFKGRIYQTYGNLAPEVYKVGGKDMEGTLVASSVGFVPSQMDVKDPVRQVSAEMQGRYERQYGSGSWNGSAGNAFTAEQLFVKAIAGALKVAQPGSQEFRAAVRDEIEKTKDMVTASGYINMTKADHSGYDDRSTAMFEFRGGAWHLLK